MSYESPIRIIAGNMTTKIEDGIMSVVQSYGIEVDKAELMRALQYDRGQYEKGYDDGKVTRIFEGVKPYKYGKRWYCGECSTAIGRFWHFCQYCGMKIKWDEVDDENA